MLSYIPEPTYELALSGGTMYAYVWYLAYYYGCSQRMIHLSWLLSVSSVWFHSTKSVPSFLMDQIVLNSWTLVIVYESYLRSWIAFGLAILCVLYAVLMFYVGQMKNTFAYHPSRFISIFFHITVHMLSAMGAIITITMFSIPK